MRFLLSLLVSSILAMAQSAGPLVPSVAPAALTISFNKASDAAVSAGPIILTAPADNYFVYNVVVPAPYNSVVNLSQTSGFVPPGQSQSVSVTVVATGMAAGAYQFPIMFQALTGTSLSVGVTLNISDGAGWITPGSQDRLVPHIAAGNGWKTTIRMVNSSTEVNYSSVNFYDVNGRSQSFMVNGYSTDYIPAIAVPASGVVDLEINSNGALLIGTARVVRQAGPVVGVNAIYKNTAPAFESSVEVKSPTVQTLAIAFNNAGRNSTGVALTNGLNYAQTVSLIFTDANGVVLGLDTGLIPANGQISFTLDQKYSFTVGKRGLLKVVGSHPALAGFGLKFDLVSGVFYTEPAF